MTGHPAGSVDCGLIAIWSVRRSCGLGTEARTGGAQRTQARCTPGIGGVRVAGVGVCEPAERGAWSRARPWTSLFVPELPPQVGNSSTFADRIKPGLNAFSRWREATDPPPDTDSAKAPARRSGSRV